MISIHHAIRAMTQDKDLRRLLRSIDNHAVFSSRSYDGEYVTEYLPGNLADWIRDRRTTMRAVAQLRRIVRMIEKMAGEADALEAIGLVAAMHKVTERTN